MITGVIGDTHLPFALPWYREWVKKVFKQWGVERVVHVGDLLDHHAISFHSTETDAYGPTQEMEWALRELRKWQKTFPEMYICKGNHDKLPARKLKEVNLPSQWLRGIEEVYDFPEGWEMADEWVFDGVLYTHTVTGINGARNLAKAEMMSAVAGHSHTQGGVSYITTRRGKSIFGLASGCGIDKKAYSMRFGKEWRVAPVIGCGIVLGPTEAYFVKAED